MDWIVSLLAGVGLISPLIAYVCYMLGKRQGRSETIDYYQAKEISDPKPSDDLAFYIAQEIQVAINKDLNHIGPFYFEDRDDGMVNIKGFNSGEAE